MAVSVDKYQTNPGGVMNTPAFKIGMGALTGGGSGAATGAASSLGAKASAPSPDSTDQSASTPPSPMQRRLSRFNLGITPEPQP